jgi:hypothetical protein
MDEEHNANVVMFFYLLKDSEEPLWDGCINYSKLSRQTSFFFCAGLKNIYFLLSLRVLYSFINNDYFVY